MTSDHCYSCGADIAPGIPFCPYCGKHQITKDSSFDLEDPYEVLQVSRNADQEVIEAAYKSLAKKYHPDSGYHDPDKMKMINWAHQLLKDPSKRRYWDDQHDIEKSSMSQAQTSKTKSPSSKSKQTSKTATSGIYREPRVASATRDRSKIGSRWLIIIGAILVLAYLFMNLSAKPASETNFNSPLKPTATRTQRPRPSATRTPRTSPTRTPTNVYNTDYLQNLLGRPNPDSCIHWTKVTVTYVDKKICVYGTIVKFYSTEQYAQIIRFSDEAGTFLLKGERYYYQGLQKNTCVYAEGWVKSSGTYLFMDIANTDLYTGSGCN